MSIALLLERYRPMHQEGCECSVCFAREVLAKAEPVKACRFCRPSSFRFEGGRWLVRRSWRCVEHRYKPHGDWREVPAGLCEGRPAPRMNNQHPAPVRGAIHKDVNHEFPF